MDHVLKEQVVCHLLYFMKLVTTFSPCFMILYASLFRSPFPIANEGAPSKLKAQCSYFGPPQLILPIRPPARCILRSIPIGFATSSHDDPAYAFVSDQVSVDAYGWVVPLSTASLKSDVTSPRSIPQSAWISKHNKVCDYLAELCHKAT